MTTIRSSLGRVLGVLAGVLWAFLVWDLLRSQEVSLVTLVGVVGVSLVWFWVRVKGVGKSS